MQLKIPVNSSVLFKDITKKIKLGNVSLYQNKKLDLVINKIFNEKLIKYDDTNYQNAQGSSKFFQNHMLNVLKIIQKFFPKKTKIIEIGSGKGDFFKLLKKKYSHIYGYDKSYDGSDIKIKKKYITASDRINADLVILRHTLEHIKNPYFFLKMLKKVFPKKTKILIEVPDHDWSMKNLAFWDIRYEHVNYFTLKSLSILFNNKIFFKKKLFNKQYIIIIASIDDLSSKFLVKYKNKKFWNMQNFYKIFLINNKISYINNKLKNNSILYLWGAGSAGSTFLYHCFVKKLLLDKIPYVVDVDPKKIGKYLQYSRKKILHPKKLLRDINKDDCILIANRNYKNEIIKYVKNKTNKKINFITL